MIEMVGKTTAEVARCLLSEEKQVRVEGEGLLPDRCDDIRRIVGARPSVTVSQKRLYCAEGRLYCEITGSVSVLVLYSGEDATEDTGLTSHSFTESFTQRFEVGQAERVPEPYHLVCRPVPVTALARAQSKKKCSYSATFLLSVQLYANGEICYLHSSEAELETREERFSVSSLADCHEESYELEEIVALPPELDAISELLDYSFTLSAKRFSENETGAEVILSANFVCSYTPETGEGELSSFVLPLEISEQLHRLPPDAEWKCQLSASADGVRAEVLSDEYGARRSLKVSMSYTVTAAYYETQTLALIRDAYRLTGDCEPQYDTYRFSCLVDSEEYKASGVTELSLRDPIKSAESCRVRASVRGVEVEDDQATISLSLSLSALGLRKEDGRVFAIEETFQTECVKNLGSAFTGMQVRVRVEEASVAAVPSEGGMSAKWSVVLTLFAWRESTGECLCGFLTDEEEKEPFCGVRFYYPSPEEKLWEIAKEFRVTRESLQKQNALTEDAPLPHMLTVIR